MSMHFLNFSNFLKRKNHPEEMSAFSRFFLYASERKKKEVFMKAAQRTNEEQYKLLKEFDKEAS